MAVPTEIKGSRQERQGSIFTQGVMMFASLDRADIASVPTTFTPPGGSAETTAVGRKLVDVDVDPNTVPGVFLFTAHYKGVRAYA